MMKALARGMAWLALGLGTALAVWRDMRVQGIFAPPAFVGIWAGEIWLFEMGAWWVRTMAPVRKWGFGKARALIAVMAISTGLVGCGCARWCFSPWRDWESGLGRPAPRSVRNLQRGGETALLNMVRVLSFSVEPADFEQLLGRRDYKRCEGTAAAQMYLGMARQYLSDVPATGDVTMYAATEQEGKVVHVLMVDPRREHVVYLEWEHD